MNYSSHQCAPQHLEPEPHLAATQSHCPYAGAWRQALCRQAMHQISRKFLEFLHLRISTFSQFSLSCESPLIIMQTHL